MGLNEDALKHYTMALDETDADESLESYRLARFWHHVESGDSGEAFKIDYIYDEVSWTNLACNLAQFYGASSIEKLKELNVDPEFNAITWESLSNRFFAMGLYLEAINAIKAYLDIDSTNVKYIAKLCALLNNFKLFGEALHYGEKYFKEKNYDGYILEQLCVSSIGCTNYQKTVGYFEELKKIEGYDNRHFMDIFELIIKQNEG